MSFTTTLLRYILDDLDDMISHENTIFRNDFISHAFMSPNNRSGNEVHILPLFLREDSSEFYECPSDFFHADKHSVFTRDFDSISVELSTATVYYYGIDTKTYEPKVSTLSYSQADDCFYIDNGIQSGHIKAFEKEVVKEALYLQHNP